MGCSDGIGIDDLIGDDDVTVLESKGLENTFKNFIFGVVASGFYKFALAHEGGYLAEDQYETVLVIEEANEVLTGSDTAGPRSPTGWFVCRTSRTFDFKDSEPILVQISRLNINPPSNLELDELLIRKAAAQSLQVVYA